MKFYEILDRFCARNERYGIKNLMLYVVIGNVAVYLLSIMDSRQVVLSFLAFSRSGILRGQVWRLITYVLVPDVAYGSSGMLSAFLFAVMLYFYYTIGKILEQQWGSLKLTLFYFGGVLITSIAAVILNGYAAASYVNLTLFLAFATMYPETRVLFFFFIPIKMKYMAYAALALELLSVIINIRLFPANLLPLAAIINYCLFFAPFLRSVFGRVKYRRSDNVVNFRKAKRQAEQEQKNAPYRHKCAVCGRTDADHPELEFRYCSRCNGYYCYCQDHINTHVHVL